MQCIIYVKERLFHTFPSCRGGDIDADQQGNIRNFTDKDTEADDSEIYSARKSGSILSMNSPAACLWHCRKHLLSGSKDNLF